MEMPVSALTGVTIKEMFDAGLHFGHQTKRWNPKMKGYIFDKRNGIHIIDLTQSVQIQGNRRFRSFAARLLPGQEQRSVLRADGFSGRGLRCVSDQPYAAGAPRDLQLSGQKSG